MGYLVRPECPKCGDSVDVGEIIIGSGKKRQEEQPRE